MLLPPLQHSCYYCSYCYTATITSIPTSTTAPNSTTTTTTTAPAHLNHGDEVAEEAAEDPVLHEEDGEREGQQREAHHKLTHGDVHEVGVGGVPVEAAAEDVGDHGGIARHAAHHEEAVEEDEERVHVGEGGAEVRPSQVHRLVGEGLKVVDNLRQELVGDAADVSSSFDR